MRVFFVTRNNSPSKRDRFYQWLVSLISPTFTHVAVGNQVVTLSPSMKGNQFWPTHDFLAKYPGVAGWFEVPARANQWGKYENIGPRGAWQYVGRLFGRQNAHTDCVTTVCDVIGFPPTLTPDQLWDYLREQGYEWTSTGPEVSEELLNGDVDGDGECVQDQVSTARSDRRRTVYGEGSTSTRIHSRSGIGRP